ncbi:hypothetical protein A343_1862 [Porphyromonas gingivalis JCVI SC001]|nr:hypothetical protein A343_1862 [Porphyromonas gingivalis JCVI SC001]
MIDGIYTAIITRCNTHSYKTEIQKKNFHQSIKKGKLFRLALFVLSRYPSN